MRSRVDFSVLTRRSSGGRPDSARASSIQFSPKLSARCGTAHSGTSPRTWSGAPASGSAAVSRAASSSVTGAGAKRSPSKLALSAADILAPFAHRHRQHQRPRRVRAHGPGMRRLPPQRVVDEVADRRAVPCPGEAVGEAPGLQPLGDGAAVRVDIGEHVDGGGNPAGQAHWAGSEIQEAPAVSTPAGETQS